MLFITLVSRTHILVDPILVNSPDRGHVSGQELRQWHVLVAGSGADQSGLSDCRVTHDHALDQFLVRLLIVHHRQSPLLMQYAFSPARSLEFRTAVSGADDSTVVSVAADCVYHIRQPDCNTTSPTLPQIRYALKLIRTWYVSQWQLFLSYFIRERLPRDQRFNRLK